jgi:hypothetical protein
MQPRGLCPRTTEGASILQNIKKSMVEEARRMWETCAVDVRVSLPKSVAAEVEEVQKSDPDMLSRMVLYAVTRRTIFDHLATRSAFGTKREGT